MRLLLSLARVFAIVTGERNYQDSKGVSVYGPDGPASHTVGDYLVYMQDYLDEAKHTSSRVWGSECVPKTMDALRKVIALGVACAQEHGMPQRIGFEIDTAEADGSSIVSVEEAVIHYSAYYRLSMAVKLMESLPPDWGGFDHSESRGDAGGGYHQPMLAPVIANMRARLLTLVGSGKTDSPTHTSMEAPGAQLDRLRKHLEVEHHGALDRNGGNIANALLAIIKENEAPF